MAKKKTENMTTEVTDEPSNAAKQDKTADFVTFKITVPSEFSKTLEQHLRAFNIGRQVKIEVNKK